METPVAWAEVYAEAEALSAAHTEALGTRAVDVLHVASAAALGAKDFYTCDARQKALAVKAGMKVKPEVGWIGLALCSEGAGIGGMADRKADWLAWGLQLTKAGQKRNPSAQRGGHTKGRREGYPHAHITENPLKYCGRIDGRNDTVRAPA